MDMEDIATNRHELYNEVLRTLYHWGEKGARREDFYNDIPALRYADLKDILDELEAEAYVFMEWTSTAIFIAYITEDGISHAEYLLKNLKEEAKPDFTKKLDAKSIERL